MKEMFDVIKLLIIPAIALLLIGNTALVSIDKWIEKQFDWEIWKQGSIRYLIILVACACAYVSGYLIQLGYETEIAVDIIFASLLAFAVKLFNKVVDNIQKLLEVDIKTTIKTENKGENPNG